MLYKLSPSYSHLRIFGCLAHISTLSRHRTKFDSRAILCVFIGYHFGTKGYKFYNLHTQSIVLSRDVVFHEHVFPFAINLTHTSADGSFLKPISSSLDFPVPLPIPISDITSDSPVFTPSPTFSPEQLSSPFQSVFPHSSPSQSSNSLPVPAVSIPQPSQSDSVPIRKSTRPKHKPKYLENYHCQLASSIPSLSSFAAQQSDTIVSKTGTPYSFPVFLSFI